MGKYKKLEKKLGVEFDDTDLLEQALTHPSYAMDNKCSDNQRLEFLGDAVLQLCVSDVLYRRYPNLHEGQMTRRRAALVCEANLAKAARELQLGDWLRLGHGEETLGGRRKPSILADAMEAVIAAIYRDSGYKSACAFINRIMDDYEAAETDTRDAKSRLQEAMQQNGGSGPVYEIIDESGPPNARIFTARVLRENGEEIGRGRGTRKQWAEEAAAEQALTVISKKP
ncbi:MAG: ribonuclease III [Clostridia bacterium]|nr:ribonuclease III [Clostridia bacterium]